MDTLAELLDGVRARDALITQTVISPEWSLRFASDAPLTMVAMMRGQGWIVPAGGTAAPIRPGDVAIIRGPTPYTVSADLADQVITVPTRACGVPEDGPALLLSGAYGGRSGVSERLLDALPGVLVIPDADCHCPMLDAVAGEVARDKPGQQTVLDRLLDLMLISTLRGWFDRPEVRAPVWYREPDDPVAAQALRLLHDNPAHPWTVAGLAAKTGVSRATLARRFTAQVGEPPMAYLTGWRTALAADLLRETDATVGSIARKVGYANTFALSVAFKRRRGITPTEHRAAATRRSHAG